MCWWLLESTSDAGKISALAAIALTAMIVSCLIFMLMFVTSHLPRPPLLSFIRNTMADDDSSTDFQKLFASLRKSSSKSYGALDGSPGPTAVGSQPYSFEVVNTSSQIRLPQTHSSLHPSNLLQSKSSAQLHGQTSLTPQTPPAIADSSGVDRTANLLNLLKFSNQPGPNPSTRSQPKQMSSFSTQPEYPTHQAPQSPGAMDLHQRGISTSDLIASSVGRPSVSSIRESVLSPLSSKPIATSTAAPMSNPQDFLLHLLNRPKSTIGPVSPKVEETPQYDKFLSLNSEGGMNEVSRFSDRPSAQRDLVVSTSLEHDASKRHESPIRVFGSGESKETTPFDPVDMPKVEPPKPSIFTYVNPFEQLAASSPRNTKPKSDHATPQRDRKHQMVSGLVGDNHKRSSKEQSPEPGYTALRRRTEPEGNQVVQSIESPIPSRPDEGRSRLETLMGIGAPAPDPETVAGALSEVGEQLSKQLEKSLARTNGSDNEVTIKEEKSEQPQRAIPDVAKETSQEVVTELKKEQNQDETSDALRRLILQHTARTMPQQTTDVAGGEEDNVKGSIKTKNSNVNEIDELAILVYNFPMKPFISIKLKQHELPNRQLDQGAVEEITRLKKEFDQIDRTLVTASNDFILYGLPKSGGLRVLRQEDGMARLIFKDSGDRVFNVAVSAAPPGTALERLQTFVATAVSGAVYWAAISRPGDDSTQDEIVEGNGLIFPPVPAYDENTSNGQLKTRAKKSNRHPEFFAIGRGKSIQIIFPLHARSSSHVGANSVVNTEKYFKERSLKINTGKAGKDFIFSEDDTAVATLDKAGYLRLWAVGDLVNESNGSVSKLAPIELKTPTLSFMTASLNEKSWPTSVLFVDKLRPYVKNAALRYLIVGMKQNHTLQLWDLAIGKAVQELSFPHEKESDAICSVAYHPASGIIVVGHPTRNSIYFIHLSAPKHALPLVSQADYLRRLAKKDTTLLRAESTAIMSGLREYSLSSIGQLRSLDLLPSPSDSARSAENEDEPEREPSLFELYVMHSTGVACLHINKADLGWRNDSKVIHPVDAEAAGCITLKELRNRDFSAPSEPSSVNGDAALSSSLIPITPKDISKASAKTLSVKGNDIKVKGTTDSPQVTVSNRTASANGTSSGTAEKSEKKKKQRHNAAVAEPTSTIPPPAPSVPEAYATAAQRARSPSAQPSGPSGQEVSRRGNRKITSTDPGETLPSIAANQPQRNVPSAESVSLGISGDFLDKEFKKIEKGVSEEFSKVFSRELESLYRRFDEDKRVHDAAGAAKQHAILRLISSTLTENVEKALSRIIIKSIEEEVLPSIADVTSSMLNTKVPGWLNEQLLHTLPAQLKLALPEAISKAVQNVDVTRVLTDQIVSQISGLIEKQFSIVLQKSVVPTFQKLATGALQRMSSEIERRINEHLIQADIKHHDDASKIDHLTSLVRGLSETVHTMATAQSEFQREILNLQQQNLRARQADSVSGHSPEDAVVPVQPPPEPYQQDLNTIKALMDDRRYEEGTIQVTVEPF